MTGQEAYALAERKARYGHRDWVVWKDRDGIYHTEPATADSLKAAMLSAGTRGKFIVKAANTGHSLLLNWSVAVSWWRNAKCGYLYL